jgi:HlyD family secretion protein
MPNRKRKYWIAIPIVAVILGVIGYFYYPQLKSSGSNQKFRTMKVVRGEISYSVTATGTINPVITVLVGSQVSGTIKALYADFNSQVKQDQVIAQIDPAIFDAQVQQGRASVQNARASLQNAEASLQSARAGFLNAQAGLETNRANLAKAEVAVLDTKRTLDRNAELMKRNVIAQSTLDTTQANYDSALAQKEASRAQVEQAKAQIEAAQAQVETAKAQVESAKAQIGQAQASLKVSETNLNYTTIRSPVNGTVISRNVDVGQTVAASLQAPTLFTIAKDLTAMQVDTNVSEADVGRIEVGQEATFTVDAYPERTFRGKVSEVRNAPTTVQNVVTYDVVIQVGNRDFKLKPGMTANVTVLIARKEGALKVANSALRFQPSSVKTEGAADKSKEGPSPPGQQLVERLSRELNLTEEQRSKVEGVVKASRGDIQEIRDKAKPEEARARVQSLLRPKIWEFLTEEQRRKFTESSQPATAEERRPGRVWVVSPEGKPVPVAIVLGITNGTYSEVVSGDLREGTEVIVEETSGKKSQTQSGAPSLSRGLGR